MSLPLQHPVIRGNGRGAVPLPRPDNAGGSGSRRSSTFPSCSGWCGTPSPATSSGFCCSGWRARRCRWRCSGSGSSSWTRWCRASALHGRGEPIPWARIGYAHRDRALHRAGGRGAEPGLRAAGESAGRPVRQPDQRPVDAATRRRSTWSSSRTPRSTTSWSGPGGRRWGGSDSSPCCWRRCRT